MEEMYIVSGEVHAVLVEDLQALMMHRVPLVSLGIPVKHAQCVRPIGTLKNAEA